MRFTFTLALAAACLLLGAGPLAAGDWDLERWTKRTSSWDGHGVGSMVHRRTTTVTTIPGMPTPQKMVREEKKTLVKVTETEYVIKVETSMMGQWTTTEEKEPKGAQVTGTAKVEDVGEETLTIEGEAYACKKKKVSNLKIQMSGAPQSTPASSGFAWVHAEHGVLRMDMTMNVMGQSTTNTWQVKRLSVTKKVGEHTLACREVEMSNPMMGGGSNVMLDCGKVPGHIVRHEVKTKRMGTQMNSVTELIAYVKK